MVAVGVGLAGGGVDADACGDAGEDDLGDASAAQVEVEVRAVEAAPVAFGDDDVFGMTSQGGTMSEPSGTGVPPLGRWYSVRPGTESAGVARTRTRTTGKERARKAVASSAVRVMTSAAEYGATGRAATAFWRSMTTSAVRSSRVVTATGGRPFT